MLLIKVNIETINILITLNEKDFINIKRNEKVTGINKANFSLLFLTNLYITSIINEMWQGDGRDASDCGEDHR